MGEVQKVPSPHVTIPGPNRSSFMQGPFGEAAFLALLSANLPRLPFCNKSAFTLS